MKGKLWFLFLLLPWTHKENEWKTARKRTSTWRTLYTDKKSIQWRGNEDSYSHCCLCTIQYWCYPHMVGTSFSVLIFCTIIAMTQGNVRPWWVELIRIPTLIYISTIVYYTLLTVQDSLSYKVFLKTLWNL